MKNCRSNKKDSMNTLRRILALLTLLGVGTWAATVRAEHNLTLKLVKVDSEETTGEDGKGANAVDGDPATFWHTQWEDASPSHPHEIIIELSRIARIKGFTYLPRQDESPNGTIKDYEFYVSDDGKEFGQAVKKGTFEEGSEKKTVTFEPKSCRFFKLKALSEVNGEAWTSAAEIGVLVSEESSRSNALSPKRFWFDYPYQPSPGKRYWTLVDKETWEERYESGEHSRFKVVGRTKVGETPGTLLVKISGDTEKTQTGNEGNFQAFIPDVGSEKMEFMFRNKIGEEWQEWRSLAEMRGVE